MSHAKYGSEGAAADPPDKRYRNPRWLQEKYHDENMTLVEVAELCDVTDTCILKWMRKHGIDRKSISAKSASRNTKNSFKTRLNGYEMLPGNGQTVYHHRLLATLKYDIEDVSNGRVRHKNGIPWDNRLENIELKG